MKPIKVIHHGMTMYHMPGSKKHYMDAEECKLAHKHDEHNKTHIASHGLVRLA